MRSSTKAKRWLIGSLLFVPAASALGNPSDSTYRLVFADEFNGTAVDASKWAVASPGWTMPNSASTATASQVSVGSGLLTLNATRTSATAWTSGSVSSYGKYNFVGGYVEARIQLPTTPGSWPAFWGLYTGWPPEADIMEYPLTTDGGTNGLANNKYNTNFHYTNTSGAAAAGAGVVTTGSSLAGTWHTFAMDWTSGTSVRFLLDGTQVQSFNSSSVAQMANMYMILDYAVGGWPGTPSTTQWPVGFSDQTKVDWVHVWQRNSAGDGASTWNVNGGGAFATAGNWSGAVPAYSNQTAVFGRVGTAATAAISLNAWHVFGGLTFDGNATGTTAYTIGTSASAIQLANSAGATVQATALSTVDQNVNARTELWSNTAVHNDMTHGQLLKFNSEVSGNGSLTVDGVGTVVIAAPSIYTGGTVIGSAQGPAVLRAAANNALGAGGVVIGSAGNASTARLELAGNSAINNNVDFRGRNNSSVGIQNVSGNNTISGTISGNAGGGVYQIQSDAGTLTLSGAAPGATAANVALQAGSGSRVFTLQGAGNGVVSGKIANGGGTVAITKEGTGTWTLAAANTYTGPTTINGGTLRLAPIASTAVANYSFDHVSGSSVVNDGTGGATMNGSLTGAATIVAGGRTGNAVSLASGAYVNIPNPVADLGNNASWTVTAWVKTTTAGATILSKSDGGWGNGNTIFYLGDGSAGGSGGVPSGVRYAGGFFQGASTDTPVNDGAWHQVSYVNNGGTYSIYTDGVAQALSPDNSGFGNADVGGTIRLGATTDTFAGDGTVNFNGLLDGVQVYGQALSAAQIAGLYAGTLNTGGLPATTDVTIASGATLDLNGAIQPIASLTGPAGASVQLGGGQLFVGSVASTTFGGAIAGTGSLVKQGVGNLTLTGVNTYTGATVVTAGTLTIGASNALSTSPITVNGGKFALASGLPSAAAVRSLTISGGSVELNNSSLVVAYQAGESSAAAATIADIAAGRITSDQLAGNASLAIGYATGVELGGTFQGTPLDATSLAILVTEKGDANLDTHVDFIDLLALAKSYGVATGASWAQGDGNYDGAVNFTDLLALAKNYGQTAAPAAELPGGAFAADWALAQALAPEPASLATVLAASAGLLARCRRQRGCTVP